MVSYRITKYNPKNRNEDGSYKDQSEWTSICHIKNPEYGNVSYEDYEKIENAYIEAIKLILIAKGIDTVKVDSIGKRDKEHLDVRKNEEPETFTNLDVNYSKDIECLKDGYEIGFWEIDKPVRLILREIIWMNLVDTRIKIIFGYDYYMYIECEELSFGTEIDIGRMGLYVERNVRQWEVIFK